jgi:hypothetical protein
MQVPRSAGLDENISVIYTLPVDGIGRTLQNPVLGLLVLRKSAENTPQVSGIIAWYLVL